MRKAAGPVAAVHCGRHAGPGGKRCGCALLLLLLYVLPAAVQLLCCCRRRCCCRHCRIPSIWFPCCCRWPGLIPLGSTALPLLPASPCSDRNLYMECIGRHHHRRLRRLLPNHGAGCGAQGLPSGLANPHPGALAWLFNLLLHGQPLLLHSGAVPEPPRTPSNPLQIAYIIDTPRCVGPQTFMTNMLQVGLLRRGLGGSRGTLGGSRPRQSSRLHLQPMQSSRLH